MRRRDFLISTAAGAALPLMCQQANGLLRTAPAALEASGPLRRHPENPRYFADAQGRALLLTGSHTWNNLVDMGSDDPPPPFDFATYLKYLNKYRHNFIRLWTWESTIWDARKTNWEGPRALNHVAPLPYARTGPGAALDGKPKFDLTKYDPEYFQRLRTRVAAAGQQGVYVSIMLFEGWNLQFGPGAWEAHPYHPQNNVNGIGRSATGDGRGLQVHELADPAITARQEAYVKKVVDTVNDLDNVLYEISNENHPASTAWQYHMINLIHQYESDKPKQHPVGMTFQYKAGSNKTLFDSPADWISPNPDGGYRDNPPAADGKKVIISDTDHLWGIGGNQAWVWKSLMRGLNPIFMDPYDGSVLGKSFDPRWEPIHRSMDLAVEMLRWCDLSSMTPRGELASSGYCLADPGKKYLVYAPGGGTITLDTSAADKQLNMSWTYMNPNDGGSMQSGSRSAESKAEFHSSWKGDAVLYVKLS